MGIYSINFVLNFTYLSAIQGDEELSIDFLVELKSNFNCFFFAGKNYKSELIMRINDFHTGILFILKTHHALLAITEVHNSKMSTSFAL